MLIARVRDRFVNQGLNISKSLLPLLSGFEFKLMVLEHACNDLVLAFRDVDSPPVFPGTKLTDNGA